MAVASQQELEHIPHLINDVNKSDLKTSCKSQYHINTSCISLTTHSLTFSDEITQWVTSLVSWWLPFPVSSFVYHPVSSHLTEDRDALHVAYTYLSWAVSSGGSETIRSINLQQSHHQVKIV